MFRESGSVHWWELLLVHHRDGGPADLRHGVQPIIDREIDARNPRTAGRELVTGAMSYGRRGPAR